MKPGLTLSRKVDESVIVTDRITGKHIVTVTLLGLRETCAKLHFAADMDYAIWRNELVKRAEVKPGDVPSDSTDGG